MTGADPFTHIIRHCDACKSTQHFIYGTDTLLNFYLKPKSELYEYQVYYDIRTKKLVISRTEISGDIGTDNFDIKLITEVSTTLSEFPAWLAPNFISEHRIQTLKVFS